MVINLRQNTNDDSTAFGKYFAEVDAKEPLNLKGLAKHMMEHGKISSEEMCNLVLGEMVKCLVHLLREGQPVKLDGFGTFSPSVDGQGLGKNDIETAVAAGADAMINGIRINFTPENTKGEQLTSRALKKECVFEWGYVVQSVILKKVCPCIKVAVAVIGVDVPHAHIHLVPLNRPSDLNFGNHIAMSSDELADLARQIGAAIE